MSNENFKKTLDNLPQISTEEAANLIQENDSTDRYEALGIPYPDPATMCEGQCDGIGFYPCKNDEDIEPIEYAAWLDQHNKPGAHDEDGGVCDGWHFIKCFECGGSGLRTPETEN